MSKQINPEFHEALKNYFKARLYNNKKEAEKFYKKVLRLKVFK